MQPPAATSSGRGAAKDGSKKRAFYEDSFKRMVVQSALGRPINNRIKPTCALFPGIEPCQLRKWIQNLEGHARAVSLEMRSDKWSLPGTLIDVTPPPERSRAVVHVPYSVEDASAKPAGESHGQLALLASIRSLDLLLPLSSPPASPSSVSRSSSDSDCAYDSHSASMPVSPKSYSPSVRKHQQWATGGPAAPDAGEPASPTDSEKAALGLPGQIGPMPGQPAAGGLARGGSWHAHGAVGTAPVLAVPMPVVMPLFVGQLASMGDLGEQMARPVVCAQMHGGPMQMQMQMPPLLMQMCPPLAVGPVASRAAPQLLQQQQQQQQPQQQPQQPQQPWRADSACHPSCVERLTVLSSAELDAALGAALGDYASLLGPALPTSSVDHPLEHEMAALFGHEAGAFLGAEASPDWMETLLYDLAARHQKVNT